MQARRTREQWAALIGAFERSSQTTAEFCVAKRLELRTFRWWRWRLRETAAPARQSECVQLVPVSVTRALVQSGGAGEAIMIGVSGIEMRVEVGTDVAYVSELVANLRARC